MIKQACRVGLVQVSNADSPPLRAWSAALDELNIPHNWSMMVDIRAISDDSTNLNESDTPGACHRCHAGTFMPRI